MRPSATTIVLAVALAGCAGNPGPGDLQAGSELCYRIEANAAAEALRLPWGFALTGDLLPLPRPGDRRTAETLTEAGQRLDYPLGAWWISDEGTIQIGSISLGSVHLSVTPENDGLRGTARSTGDAGRPGTISRNEVDGVMASVVACPTGVDADAGEQEAAKPRDTTSGSTR